MDSQNARRNSFGVIIKSEIEMINRSFFFAQVRKTLFRGHMQPSQVDGMTAILDYWEQRFASNDDRWLAYALGTTYHETAFTMEPIEEYGKGRRHEYGIPDPETGEAYYGRGFVQLTWDYNYKKMGEILGVDLYHHPELALERPTATRILFAGMIGGFFTKKKLGDFFSSQENDWVHARKIINGLDHAGQIAQYGHEFYAAISYTTGESEPETKF